MNIIIFFRIILNKFNDARRKYLFFTVENEAVRLN